MLWISRMYDNSEALSISSLKAQVAVTRFKVVSVHDSKKDRFMK